MTSSKKTNRNYVIGHEEVRHRLSETLRSGRAAHAYLFSGPEGIGKTAVALEFAQLLLCDQKQLKPCGTCDQCRNSRLLQHPDLRIYFPLPPRKSSGGDDEEREFSEVINKVISALSRDWYANTRPPNAKEIRLRLVRSMLRSASLKPYQAASKVFILLHAETMNEESQNALLKVLEEPSPDSYFLLVTDQEVMLKPTVRSRCQRVQLPPLPQTVIRDALVQNGIPAPQAELASHLSGGSFVHAVELSGPDIEKTQENVLTFLRAASSCDPQKLPDAAAGLLNPESPTESIGLEMLGLFLRDAAMIQAARTENAPGHLTFGNLEQKVRAVVSYFPEADFEAAVHAVDESAHYLARGYTKELILYVLAIRLNTAFGSRPRTKQSAIVS